MQTKKTPELIQHMLDCLFDDNQVKESLTPWEIDFLSSVKRGYKKYSNLTDKQFVILERIYAEKTV